MAVSADRQRVHLHRLTASDAPPASVSASHALRTAHTAVAVLDDGAGRFALALSDGSLAVAAETALFANIARVLSVALTAGKSSSRRRRRGSSLGPAASPAGLAFAWFRAGARGPAPALLYATDTVPNELRWVTGAQLAAAKSPARATLAAQFCILPALELDANTRVQV